jgi:hypothetical protein
MASTAGWSDADELPVAPGMRAKGMFRTASECVGFVEQFVVEGTYNSPASQMAVRCHKRTSITYHRAVHEIAGRQ